MIRHQNDYGSIILLDQRYNQIQYYKDISLWVRERIKVYEEAKDTILPLKQFFQEAESYCSQFKSAKAARNENLVDRIRDSNQDLESLKEKARDFRNLKRDYKSLDSEKELKRTLRNDHYKSQQFQNGNFASAANNQIMSQTLGMRVFNALNSMTLDNLMNADLTSIADKTSQHIQRQISESLSAGLGIIP